MQRLALVVLLTIGLSLVPASAQKRQTVTVASVVDGDTIKVQVDGGPVLTVRLIGIDAPGTEHPLTKSQSQVAGKETL